MIQLHGFPYSIARFDKYCLNFKEFMEAEDLGKLNSAFAIIPVEAGFTPRKRPNNLPYYWTHYYYFVNVQDFNSPLRNKGIFHSDDKQAVWLTRGALPEVGPVSH